MEGGGVTPSCFFIRCHGLGGVDSRKGVAKGHKPVLALGAVGGDHFHIGTGTLETVISPGLLERSVEEALGVGGVHARLPGHAGFHLQVVEYSLLADVGQGAGGAVHYWRRIGTNLLTRLKVSHCIQTLATEQTETRELFCLGHCRAFVGPNK